ncbi:MAG: hypothetical protein KGI68_13320, partial [Alphaproteobacteria bacterium]|nr:hypothetical protein [Alphaproteobacteria bacterium]
GRGTSPQVPMRSYYKVSSVAAAGAFAIALVSQSAIGAEEQPTVDICKTPSVVTLTGKIRSPQSMREEPQAELQTYFFLDLAAPLCGTTTVSASVIDRLPCAEGDTVTMTGEFSPPEKMFNTAFFRGRAPVSCRVVSDHGQN